MKADTWMAFYVGDYLADTLTLTTRQHGAYLLLILACWKGNGFVPNDDETLAAITKLGLKEWQHDKGKLVRYFQITDDRWTHDRVERELADALRNSQRRSNAGKEAAARRWHMNGNANGMPNGQQNDAPSPSPSPRTGLTTTLPATSAGHAHALPDDWNPSAEAMKAAKIARPDLVDADIATETVLFRNHAKANNRSAFNWEPNWSSWIMKAPARKASKPDVSLPIDKNGDDQWRARLRAWRSTEFWQPNDWGPPPGERGCLVPSVLLTEGHQ